MMKPSTDVRLKVWLLKSERGMIGSTALFSQRIKIVARITPITR
jgi:hypothetical protein